MGSNMERPTLAKIVFNRDPGNLLLASVKSAAPAANVVVAEGERLRDEIVDAQVVVGGRIDDELLDAAKQLVWQHMPSAGVESVVSPILIERGIILTNGRGVSAPNMGEHMVGMMLALGRAIPFLVRQQAARHWTPMGSRPPMFELTGQTVLLLGTGAIGKEIAKRLRPFGCSIIGARRRAEPVEGFDRIVSFAELGDFLPEVDHVASSLPMTPYTDKLLSADLIARMKPGAFFYNVGRGGTVDQEALIAALQDGRLGGAGLDVVEPEPLPEDSPLWTMENVLMTSHSSGGSPRTGERSAEVLRENVRRYIAGEDLLNIVDLEYGY